MLKKNLLLVFVAVIGLGANAASFGLVLSGGGAKGAYEVGVWAALHEANLVGDVVAISGTSIGAVNAALFASWPDFEGVEKLWLKNIGEVFVPNEKILQLASEKKLVEFRDAKLREYADIADIPVEKLPVESRMVIIQEAEDEFRRKGILKDLATVLETYGDSLAGKASDGLCDGFAMRRILEENLPKVWLRTAPRVYVTALATDHWTTKTFCLNEGTVDERICCLLASTAIPIFFPPVEINGISYVDGGWVEKSGDNTPIGPILNNHPEIKTIIVVYLTDRKNLRRRVRKVAEEKGVRLVEIVPSEDIGGKLHGWQGIFDSSPKTVTRLIDLGRRDTRRVLREENLIK